MKAAHLAATLWTLALTASPAMAQWSFTALTEPRTGLAATSVGDRALFAGGFAPSPAGCVLTDVVELYDASLGHPADPAAWTVAALSEPRSELAAVSVGGYALFAGGTATSGDSSVVDVYVAATDTWGLAHLSQASGGLSAATVGSLALFADGSVVEIYDASMGPPTDPGSWRVDPVPVSGLGTSVGSYALFVGDGVLHVYDGSSSTWSAHALATPGHPRAAVSVGSRALFAFYSYEPAQNEPDRLLVAMYDTRDGEPPDPAAWSWIDVGGYRSPTGAAALGGRAVIASAEACSTCGDGLPSGTMDVFFDSTGEWLPAPQFAGLGGQAATAVAKYALFAGGTVFFPGDPPQTYLVASVGIYEQDNYCSVNANSTGLPARMTVGGTASLADDDFCLRAEPVPDQAFLFFFGPQQQELPFGDGFLCVGGGLTRVGPPQAAVGGVAQRTLDLPSVGITAPGTLHFQCRFRDPAAGGAMFNTSDATSVTFVP
jgi:hypothetical protein